MTRRIVYGLLPLLVFFLLTVGVGLVHAFLQSVYAVGPTAAYAGSSNFASAYIDLFARPEFVRSFFYSVYIAGASAALSVVLGALFAYVLRWAPRYVQAIGSIYHLPIILPHIVVAFLTMVIWSPTGIFSSFASRLGFDLGSRGFPVLLNAPNGIGVILAYVYKEFPFVTLMALGVLRVVPDRMIITARMFGAGTIRTFRSVGLPAMLPALNQLFIILFLYALGGFEIPWILGASRPQMIPITVYSLYFQGSLGDRAVAMAALSLLAMFAAIFVVLYARVANRLSSRERPV